MKLVVLDGYTLNPGDLSWNELEKSGDLKIYDRTAENEIVERCEDAEAIFTNKTKLSSDILSKLGKLKYIGVLATGYDVVDIKFATENDIIVTNVPDYSSNSVAQSVFAMILSITNRISEHSRNINKWSKCPDFSYSEYNLIELSGKKLGIIGFGNIGKKVASIGKAFGMDILVSTRTIPAEFDWIEFMNVEDLAKESDVITLHCPLTETTNNLINKKMINLMKKNAIIINTARGPLINEEDLLDAVLNEKIYGAALDVLKKEPPESGNILFNNDKIIITPHIAWATFESRSRLMDKVVKNFKAYLEEKPVNVVKG